MGDPFKAQIEINIHYTLTMVLSSVPISHIYTAFWLAYNSQQRGPKGKVSNTFVDTWTLTPVQSCIVTGVMAPFPPDLPGAVNTALSK